MYVCLMSPLLKNEFFGIMSVSQWKIQNVTSYTHRTIDKKIHLAFDCCVWCWFLFVFFRVKVIASIYRVCFRHKLSMIFWMNKNTEYGNFMNRNWRAHRLAFVWSTESRFSWIWSIFTDIMESIPFEIVHTVSQNTQNTLTEFSAIVQKFNWKMSTFCSTIEFDIELE